ncbi:MAG: phage tail protein [candidate division Zixibacteria bacterium]|nr:phage tail protein [candidate division Zixibacteria bacterium]
MSRRFEDPFLNYNFKFILGIDGFYAAGFTECSGLQAETKTFQYKEGGRNNTTLHFPEHTSYGNITLKTGITFINDLLLDWQQDIATGQFRLNPRSSPPGGLRENAKPVAIILLDELRDEVWRWTLIGAIPVKWVGPDLKSTGNEVAIETIEIAHEGFRVE